MGERGSTQRGTCPARGRLCSMRYFPGPPPMCHRHQPNPSTTTRRVPQVPAGLPVKSAAHPQVGRLAAVVAHQGGASTAGLSRSRCQQVPVPTVLCGVLVGPDGRPACGAPWAGAGQGRHPRLPAGSLKWELALSDLHHCGLPGATANSCLHGKDKHNTDTRIWCCTLLLHRGKRLQMKLEENRGSRGLEDGSGGLRGRRCTKRNRERMQTLQYIQDGSGRVESEAVLCLCTHGG